MRQDNRAVENYSGPTDTLCSYSWTTVILSGSHPRVELHLLANGLV